MDKAYGQDYTCSPPCNFACQDYAVSRLLFILFSVFLLSFGSLGLVQFLCPYPAITGPPSAHTIIANFHAILPVFFLSYFLLHSMPPPG